VDGRCVAQATSWVTVNTSVAFAGMLLPGGDKGKEGRDSTCGLMVTVVPSAWSPRLAGRSSRAGRRASEVGWPGL